MPSTVEYENCTDCCGDDCDAADCDPECQYAPGNIATVAVSGLSAGTGCTSTECTDLNTTHNLAGTAGSSCAWAKSGGGTGCASSTIILKYVCSTNLLRLRFVRQTGPGTTVDIAVYEANPTLPWDCDGNETVSLVSNTAHCSGWPSTLTVTLP